MRSLRAYDQFDNLPPLSKLLNSPRQRGQLRDRGPASNNPHTTAGLREPLRGTHDDQPDQYQRLADQHDIALAQDIREIPAERRDSADGQRVGHRDPRDDQWRAQVCSDVREGAAYEEEWNLGAWPIVNAVVNDELSFTSSADLSKRRTRTQWR